MTIAKRDDEVYQERYEQRRVCPAEGALVRLKEEIKEEKGLLTSIVKRGRNGRTMNDSEKVGKQKWNSWRRRHHG